MAKLVQIILSLILATFAFGYHYDPAYLSYNLNTNQTARTPTDYWGQRPDGHDYHPSPDNWRMPFYTIFLDRFVNSDPFNDNINGTLFEHDLDSNQLRHGGDVQGLIDSLDYLQGMGIKGLYIAGSIFMNAPSGYDGYSPLDLSLLDAHLGDLDLWKFAVDEIHARGMYVVLDNVFATMGDLIGFEGYLNETAPFRTDEHHVVWKSSRRYLDFDIGNDYNTTCQYPRFYNETGYPVDQWVVDSFSGCYNSDFDQYGDTEAFGVFPDYRRQLTKFSSVQDRLREWHEPVRLKLENFYCIMIAQLDIDGYRYDKALQATVDAMGHMNAALRTCAKRFGKDNFFLPGEITGGNQLGSVYLGRGRSPDMLPENITVAITSGLSTQDYSIREPKFAGLDAQAFHYSVYRALQRFLGMDGNVKAGYDTPVNFVDLWNTLLMTNDMTNAMTGEFDPRHMYGVTNQDLFRWPAIHNGIQRQLLGHFITTLLLPGAPLLLWGEEQEFYILDSTANNYIFGRQPISSASAWQTHGCYALGAAQYYEWPIESARNGCHDDKVSYDHRDPSAPVRNILRHMFNLRESFPVLHDGAWVQQLSNQTWEIFMPGSSGVETETGLWSVLRTGVPNIQSFNTSAIWLLYSNYNESKTYEFNCSDATATPYTTALVAPYDSGTTVKNLVHPYDEFTLVDSAQSLGFNGSSGRSTGCSPSLEMAPYGFGAYVPISEWVAPKPMITKFFVNDTEDFGHDSRLLSQTTSDGSEQVAITLYFSADVDCSAVTKSISISSTTLSKRSPTLDSSSAICETFPGSEERDLVGILPSVYSWRGVLDGVENGVHKITVGNATKDSVDHFLFRIGQANNPVVFPRSANYSSTLVHQDTAGNLAIQHAAAGADLWRYTTNWGSSYSSWMPYNGETSSIEMLSWSGTKKQEWEGQHVKVEYFSRMTGTSDIVQEGDLQRMHRRRFPHLFWNGLYNQYGFDSGLDSSFRHSSNGTWIFDFATEWPTIGQFNVWGINPDGKPDQTYVMGDVDGDSVLDRLPPSSLSPSIINITVPPPKQFIGWTINLNDATRRFDLLPVGSSKHQIALFALLAFLPLLGASAAVYVFMKGFYQVKFNQSGMTDKVTFDLAAVWEWFRVKFLRQRPVLANIGKENRVSKFLSRSKSMRQSMVMGAFSKSKNTKRTVLIGTMEYDIEDWKIKVKIGGLGVMAQLMGKALGELDLVWVIPCVGGVDYPVDTPAEPMKVTILGVDYAIMVQYHKIKNITYILLDAPVFRQQTQAAPYPARMDDLSSAIYYSAWNQCIAQAIKRFPIDLYHINDYHGCIAPLYLLPGSIPVALSLHNAEFQDMVHVHDEKADKFLQGLWPMRNAEESTEVSQVFNLTTDVVQKFVQYGGVFNMLHAGASYLRVYQSGFGAVGVSKKYGRRAHLRYPIFWGLKRVGQLPNPDPTDTEAWDGKAPRDEDMLVDDMFEAERPALRLEAQRWAGLKEDSDAELFVFVGRWSKQKGIDLIADVFQTILKKHPKTQLICVGPVIDLYGKFAALKLEKLMKKYPSRVFSKPEFTALPPCIFSGAEFALIPSRDEPFGLVAVEFGRKGALGVGARVGGLGNMPGWWYTVEAVTTQHLLDQFRQAIQEALASKRELRAVMRARSAKQRFPVQKWVEDLNILQTTAMRVHGKANKKSRSSTSSTSQLSTASTKITSREDGHFDFPGIDAHLADGAAGQPGSGFETPYVAITRAPSFGSPTPGTQTPSGTTTQAVQVHEIIATNSSTQTPFEAEPLMPLSSPPPTYAQNLSALSLPSYHTDARPLDSAAVVGTRKDYFLQQVDPFFTDTQGTYYNTFSEKLDRGSDNLDSDDLCIEQFLEKSEKDWFQMRLNAKLGREGRIAAATPALSRAGSRTRAPRAASAVWSFGLRSRSPSVVDDVTRHVRHNSDGPFEEFLLGDNYKAPKYVRKWMQVKIYDWPLYSFLLAIGQIMAANSYQITLLTGQIGQEAERVYVLCTIYFAASVIYWLLFRRIQSATLLSIPFVLYGIAFFLLGMAHFGSTTSARGWIQNTASGVYAAASASGSLYFALNFGDEGGSTVRSWIFRACAIQGTQQLYIAALWFWGAVVSQQSAKSLTPTGETPISSFLNTWKVTAITLPIAFALWLAGLVVYLGLPSYYRQIPGRIPSFYPSILRRKIIAWFFITVLIQNFFLSAQYGRSWMFLWTSQHVTYWQVALLVILFFVVVWIIVLWALAYMSKSHSWLLPILAVGLGAPRWAQMWWGVSGIGAWLPWTNGYVASALVSRSLWLWLGLLDTLQNIGIGMILLSTMTRIHVAFTLITAQAAGSIMTAVARACAPNNIGPGPVFPNILMGISTVANGWFWIGLLLNLGICFGFFMFFRKEQLSKP